MAPKSITWAILRSCYVPIKCSTANRIPLYNSHSESSTSKDPLERFRFSSRYVVNLGGDCSVSLRQCLIKALRSGIHSSLSSTWMLWLPQVSPWCSSEPSYAKPEAASALALSAQQIGIPVLNTSFAPKLTFHPMQHRSRKWKRAAHHWKYVVDDIICSNIPRLRRLTVNENRGCIGKIFATTERFEFALHVHFSIIFQLILRTYYGRGVGAWTNLGILVSGRISYCNQSASAVRPNE